MSPTMELAPLRAMIVDDDAGFRRRLGRDLAEYGLDAVYFGSVVEALASVSSRLPDVLLLCARLPSAARLIEAVRSGERAGSTAIIALTDAAGRPPREIADGCDALVVKPCPVELVLERIDQHFHTRTLVVAPALAS